MPAKTPIYLKTSTPKRGRKLRLRDVLSSDMISPPLGDFRHSAHIGRDGEGDMFGELSFLQGKYDLLPRLGRCGGSPGGGYRTLLKSAISLPAFSGAQDQAPPKPPRLHLEEMPSGGGAGALHVGGLRRGLFPQQQQRRPGPLLLRHGCPSVRAAGLFRLLLGPPTGRRLFCGGQPGVPLWGGSCPASLGVPAAPGPGPGALHLG